MIDIKHIAYTYRRGATALSDASADIRPGIYLLLGQNGAGKTTLLHLLAGLLTPAAGTIDIDGENPALRRPSCLRRLFFLSDSFDCPFMTVNEMAHCHAGFYPGFDPAMLAANLGAFGLSGNERLKRLSLGDRHKSLAAYALSLGVEVLLLDEPANGLDITSKKELRRMMGRCVTDEQTVIVSTHTVSDLESLYDGLLMLNGGRLVVAQSTYNIGRRLGFVTSVRPVEGAIYQEPDAGLFRAIVPGDGCGESAVNFGLLYTAILSPAGPRIVELLNEPLQDED